MNLSSSNFNQYDYQPSQQEPLIFHLRMKIYCNHKHSKNNRYTRHFGRQSEGQHLHKILMQSHNSFSILCMLTAGKHVLVQILTPIRSLVEQHGNTPKLPLRFRQPSKLSFKDKLNSLLHIVHGAQYASIVSFTELTSTALEQSLGNPTRINIGPLQSQPELIAENLIKVHKILFDHPWNENRESGFIVDQQHSLTSIKPKGIAMPATQSPMINLFSWLLGAKFIQ